jgi:hypothetical protein
VVGFVVLFVPVLSFDVKGEVVCVLCVVCSLCCYCVCLCVECLYLLVC